MDVTTHIAEKPARTSCRHDFGMDTTIAPMETVASAPAAIPLIKRPTA